MACIVKEHLRRAALGLLDFLFGRSWPSMVLGYRVLRARSALGVLNFLFGRRPGLLDVFFAYRLLLARPPDRAGFMHYRRRTKHQGMSIEDLVEEFLESEEFKRRRAAWAERRRQLAYVSLPIEEEMLQLADFRIVVDLHDLFIGQEIKKRGTYERFVTRALRELLGAGQTFVDVGANIGYFSLVAAKLVGPSGKVIAFEPIPQNCALLEKSIALNGFDNIEVRRVAVANTNARLRLTQLDRRNSGSFRLARDPSVSREVFDVEGQRLDDALAGETVDVIKIDVEGAEGLAFQGMRRTLETSQPIVVMEYSPAALQDISGISGEALLQGFADLGYAFEDVASFDGRFRSQTASRIHALLDVHGADHLDLLLFPTLVVGSRARARR